MRHELVLRPQHLCQRLVLHLVALNPPVVAAGEANDQGNAGQKNWPSASRTTTQSTHCFQNSAMLLSYCVNVFMPDIVAALRWQRLRARFRPVLSRRARGCSPVDAPTTKTQDQDTIDLWP